jgi:hypothetical protein
VRKNNKEIRRRRRGMGVWRRLDEQLGNSCQKFENCTHTLYCKVEVLGRNNL